MVAEDNEDNLRASREAYSSIGEDTHYPCEISDFGYVRTAGTALKRIPEYDGVITDFIFPKENNGVNSRYREYVGMMKENDTFQRLVRDYFNGDETRAEHDLMETREMLVEEGLQQELYRETLKKSLNNLNLKPEEREKCQQLIDNPESGLGFAYGGVLMMEAAYERKPSVLVTEMHRHPVKALEDIPFDLCINGMIALLPLIEKEIISPEEANRDDGVHYLGFCKNNKMRPKSDPDVWREALDKLMCQIR